MAMIVSARLNLLFSAMLISLFLALHGNHVRTDSASGEIPLQCTVVTGRLSVTQNTGVTAVQGMSIRRHRGLSAQLQHHVPVTARRILAVERMRALMLARARRTAYVTR
jgi:hypothetical protein